MQTSYGVVWREGDEPLARGKLELLARELRLEGLSGSEQVTREIPYQLLEGVRVGRVNGDRLDGHPTLIVKPATGESIAIAAVAQPGVIAELAERLAGLQLENGRKTAIVLPLLPGSLEAARKLLESGPPFDPEHTELERHEVFLGESEVLFLFESPRGAEALEPLLEDADFWRSAAAWGELLAGPPHLAEPVYSWSSL
jgi:hypothetical protein